MASKHFKRLPDGRVLLSADVAKLLEDHVSDGRAVVDAAIKAGKFPESRRAHYLELYRNDPVGTAALLKRLTPALAPRGGPRGEPAPPVSAGRDAVLEWGLRTRRLSSYSYGAAGLDWATNPQAAYDAITSLTPNGSEPSTAAPTAASSMTSVMVDGVEYNVPGPTGDAPTLFPDGELPKITASGIDPKVLASVPWQARKAVAAAATTNEAYELIREYSGGDGALAAEYDALAGGPLHADVTEFQVALSKWRSGLD